MCRRVIFFLAFLLVVLAVLAYWFLSRASAPPAFLNPKSISPQAAQAAQSRLEEALHAPAVSHAAPSAAFHAAPSASANPAADAGSPVTLSFSQSDINTTLATNANVRRQMAAHGVRAAEVRFAAPDLVTADLKVTYHGEPEVAQVTGNLSASPDGSLQFTPQRAQVGGIPVPPAAVEKAIKPILAEWLPKANGALPILVRQVSVQGGELTLTGPQKKRT